MHTSSHLLTPFSSQLDYLIRTDFSSYSFLSLIPLVYQVTFPSFFFSSPSYNPLKCLFNYFSLISLPIYFLGFLFLSTYFHTTCFFFYLHLLPLLDLSFLFINISFLSILYKFFFYGTLFLPDHSQLSFSKRVYYFILLHLTFLIIPPLKSWFLHLSSFHINT